MSKNNLISSNSNILSGEMCVTGTRIPVAAIESLNKLGVPATKIAERHFPQLDVRVIRSVLKAN